MSSERCRKKDSVERNDIARSLKNSKADALKIMKKNVSISTFSIPNTPFPCQPLPPTALNGLAHLHGSPSSELSSLPASTLTLANSVASSCKPYYLTSSGAA